jgi:Stress responsive A/B Barrel Domain
MSRRTAIFTALAVAGLVALAVFSNSGRSAQEPGKAALDKTPPFVHCVIFYLKKDAPEGEADAMIADAHELLGSIPSVRGLRAGKPAAKEKPDNAKTDFQVGLLVLFDDVDGLNIYLKHPRHLEFVKKHGKYIDGTKLGVYDFADQKK